MHKHSQVKSGNDDLRQDEVIRQFFSLLNGLLRHHKPTAERDLGIRTYKVVPFTPCAGLLEWVDHTICLSEYLLGQDRVSGAHAKYAKRGDLSFMQTQKMILEAVATPAKQLSTFKAVCASFSPVLHHFFLENFRDPSDWFDKRIRFTRSVAVSSMAGYVIGETL